ncbi:outer membrane lipoprotein-sorting protein [Fimbriimonadia bacterium ATM]|nr:MAG: outer membrane lipoprotein-sorting protein [Armatimonadota bacterium]MBC6968920.1 outer membrane lipoprotein-sorting protein [Armatimonadota bacterium]MCE7900049.1 outer membrane lipoprotein-sorting protein [Armatimonadetes bacterium ATM1]MDL1929104.1 outer membrane lipoprotein-sorting protein [Fimbriimonadia bacterium ATM]RIJ95094.1 MAG: hypothetical protein DCC45_10775 [Armatimonadota bacterium]
MITLVVAAASIAAPTFADVVSSKLVDVSFTGKVVTASRSELVKINRDFAMGYEAETVQVWYKEPLLVKLTSMFNGQPVTYVIKGDRKYYKIPRIATQSEDISKSPGKRQTLLDFGIITKAMESKFLDGKFVRTEANGQAVFDCSYQYKEDTSRHRVWVDLEKKVIVKRMWYNQKGKLMATFEYSEFLQSGGIWFPGKTTIKNSEGKTAGVSRYINVKANAGIADSFFQL